jgi:TRAP-type uncharacterized transport system fused permease subunit
VTPPVSLAAFAAAGVAGANPMRTALVSWKLAKGLYIIPIVMVYRPLLGNGPWPEVVLATVTCAAGLFAFAAALDRYMFRRLTWAETIAVALAALGLFWPTAVLPPGWGPLPWASDIVGAGLLAIVVVQQVVGRSSPARGAGGAL